MKNKERHPQELFPSQAVLDAWYAKHERERDRLNHEWLDLLEKERKTYAMFKNAMISGNEQDAAVFATQGQAIEQALSAAGRQRGK